MFSKRDRVISLLEDALKEIDLLMQMSKDINTPWTDVFGMRNFLSHEYGDVDAEGIFNTVKTNIPELLPVAGQILADIQAGKLLVEDE